MMYYNQKYLSHGREVPASVLLKVATIRIIGHAVSTVSRSHQS